MVVVSSDVGDCVVCLRAECLYTIRNFYLYTYAINGYIWVHFVVPLSTRDAPYDPLENSAIRTYYAGRWFPFLVRNYLQEPKLTHSSGK